MEHSGEALGWMAAIGSMLAFGSFGVPIKSDAANAVDIDPLVFQTYKSTMCFCTSWLVLLAGVPFSYTAWGIVSCIFWVPGGVAMVFAIRNAGLAIAIGIGSSSIVLVSFIWGIFIFDEDIHSKIGASCAVGLMMMGICGMSYYSSPVVALEQQQQHDDDRARFVSMPSQECDGEGNGIPQTHIQQQQQTSLGTRLRHPQNNHGSSSSMRNAGYQGVDMNALEEMSGGATHNDTNAGIVDPSAASAQELDDMGLVVKNAAIHTTARTESCHSLTSSIPAEEFEQEYNHPSSPEQQQSTATTGAHDPLELLYIWGVPFTRRQVGIAGALFNGVWGGSILVPMKWCNSQTSGVVS